MTIVTNITLPKTTRRNDQSGFARLWKDRVAKWERSPAYHAFVEQLKAPEIKRERRARRRTPS